MIISWRTLVTLVVSKAAFPLYFELECVMIHTLKHYITKNEAARKGGIAVNLVSSYKVQILPSNKLSFKDTVQIYRNAISYLVAVYSKEWDAISAIGKKYDRFAFSEDLVHTTKTKKAKYDFDTAFYKMPSYLRRAAIHAALGAVSSYRSNLALWEVSHEGKKPLLQVERNAMPVFYNGVMHTVEKETNTHYIKLYQHNDWVWVPLKLRQTDLRYLERHWSHVKASAPILERRYNRWYLRFAFEEQQVLSDTPIQEQRICAVDLGLNTDAVCSIMAADGTVLQRKFIDFPSDKDHLFHVLNRIKRRQREHGYTSTHALWLYARRLNNKLAIKVASAITDFAVLHSADVIVFEHLDFKGRKHKGSKAQKLSLWKRNSIQEYAAHKAHRCGIRISHICAWGTSALAFDGSGQLTRNEQDHALAVFASGKQYNCDLSASYNIGARYFIRELTKPIPAKEWSDIVAKVPDVQRRTSCTLSTLRTLATVLGLSPAA